MFGVLLESRARRARNRAGILASVAGHTVLIALAVTATKTQLTARVPDQRIVSLPVLVPAPVPRSPATPAPREAPASPSAPLESFPDPLTIVPTIAPTTIPVIDPDDLIPAPRPEQWGRQRTPLGGITGPADGPGGVGDGVVPFGGGVDKPAMALSSNPAPQYPEVLRRNGVRGEVTIEVIVDTTGTAQLESLRIVTSDHPLLADAVRDALRRARYLPAESGGRKVRMWVRQSFVFEVR